MQRGRVFSAGQRPVVLPGSAFPHPRRKRTGRAGAPRRSRRMPGSRPGSDGPILGRPAERRIAAGAGRVVAYRRPGRAEPAGPRAPGRPGQRCYQVRRLLRLRPRNRGGRSPPVPRSRGPLSSAFHTPTRAKRRWPSWSAARASRRPKKNYWRGAANAWRPTRSRVEFSRSKRARYPKASPRRC